MLFHILFSLLLLFTILVALNKQFVHLKFLVGFLDQVSKSVYQNQFYSLNEFALILLQDFLVAKLLTSWVVLFLELSGILFSTSLMFVFKTVVVVHLITCIWYFLSTSPFFFPKFCLSMLYLSMWIKVVASGIFWELNDFLVHLS